MDAGVPQVYSVELFLARPVAIDKAALLEKLRIYCGNVESLGAIESDLLAFAHLDYRVRYKDGEIPAQSLITEVEHTPDLSRLSASIQQTWDWPDLKSLLSRAQCSILITDFMAAGLPYEERLDLFHGVVMAVLEIVPCLAIHWIPSQRFVNPNDYRKGRLAQEPDSLFPGINVRLFRISNGTDGEMVMDTVGLATLGLPDIQCHFVSLEPNEVARILYNTGYYLFAEGDVIEDGHTITGISPNQHWLCQHEMALVGPSRTVLDIDPGPPYAAGKRAIEDSNDAL